MRLIAFFRISGICDNNSFFYTWFLPYSNLNGTMSHIFRNRVIIRVVLLITSFLPAACTPPPGSAENGQKWFIMHNCYACHGRKAKGGKAPEIARINRGFGSFLRFIRNPQSTIMPSFPEERISRQDAADIYAWLQSLPDK